MPRTEMPSDLPGAETQINSKHAVEKKKPFETNTDQQARGRLEKVQSYCGSGRGQNQCGYVDGSSGRHATQEEDNSYSVKWKWKSGDCKPERCDQLSRKNDWTPAQHLVVFNQTCGVHRAASPQRQKTSFTLATESCKLTLPSTSRDIVSRATSPSWRTFSTSSQRPVPRPDPTCAYRASTRCRQRVSPRIARACLSIQRPHRLGHDLRLIVKLRRVPARQEFRRWLRDFETSPNPDNFRTKHW